MYFAKQSKEKRQIICPIGVFFVLLHPIEYLSRKRCRKKHKLWMMEHKLNTNCGKWKENEGKIQMREHKFRKLEH